MLYIATCRMPGASPKGKYIEGEARIRVKGGKCRCALHTKAGEGRAIIEQHSGSSWQADKDSVCTPLYSSISFRSLLLRFRGRGDFRGTGDPLHLAPTSEPISCHILFGSCDGNVQEVWSTPRPASSTRVSSGKSSGLALKQSSKTSNSSTRTDQVSSPRLSVQFENTVFFTAMLPKESPPTQEAPSDLTFSSESLFAFSVARHCSGWILIHSPLFPLSILIFPLRRNPRPLRDHWGNSRPRAQLSPP